MSASNFSACLAVILKSEGGFVLDDHTGVGATNLGVTQRTLSSWTGRTATVADVEALTVATVTPIYKSAYWNLVHGDDLPAGLDLIVFDESVNQGPSRAIRTLQQALSVAIDGGIGPKTLAAIAACNPAQMIDQVVSIRAGLYRGDRLYSEYGKAWMARLYRTAATAHSMVGEVAQTAAIAPPPSLPKPSTVTIVANGPVYEPADWPVSTVANFTVGSGGGAGAAPVAPWTPPIPLTPSVPQLPPPFTPAPVAATGPTLTTVATPARVGASVALTGLLAGATAMSQTHIVDLKGLIDLSFVYLVSPVVLGIVVGLAASLARVFNVNIQGVMAQKILTGMENGASALVSKAQTAADANSTFTTKNDLIAGTLNYVNTAFPDAVKTLGLATPAGQAQLANLAEAKVAQTMAAITPKVTP